MNNTNNYLSITDIAKILDVSRGAVNDWIVKDRIPHYIVGDLRKIRSEDLIEYLESLGNSSMAMANFKKNISYFLYEKYKDKEHLKEAKIQDNIFKKYATEKEKAILK